jgi:transposase
VATLIQREFGVRYHPRHCSRLLHDLGLRPVKPKRVAKQKDEQEKQRWLAEEAEALKKT